MSSTKGNLFKIHAWGCKDFDQVEKIQKDSAESYNLYGPVLLWGELEDVITLGFRQKDFLPESDLPQRRAQRGGLATIHSRGQLVIYPILRLRDFSLGVSAFVDLLLRVSQKALENLGLSTSCQDLGPGLYKNKKKVAFCGVRITKGITQSGVSINVSNDLSLFASIPSCGTINQEVTSLSAEGFNKNPQEVFKEWAKVWEEEILRVLYFD